MQEKFTSKKAEEAGGKLISNQRELNYFIMQGGEIIIKYPLPLMLIVHHLKYDYLR